MKNAIVTGAAGFIGSWLVSELLENDYDVTVVVRERKRLKAGLLNNRHVHCIEKTILELNDYDFLPNCDYQYFFNLAWSGVNSENKNDMELQLSNIKITVKAMEICKALNCERFLSAGTVAEYALNTDVMDLSAKQKPNDMYGAAKASTYYFIDVLSRQISQPYIWMIIPSTFGEDRNDDNILTYTISTLLKGKKPVYGELEQMWDFLYVGDVVRAIRMIAEKGYTGKVYGIGSGTYRTLKDYIIRIRDLINPALPLGIGERSSLSTKSFSSCVNTYDLIKDTGFQPRFSFEDGMKRTIDYYRNAGGVFNRVVSAHVTHEMRWAA